MVILLTLGKAYFSLPGVWEAQNHRVRELRLDPLATFRTSRVWWGPWLNLVGNVVLFAPVGFVAYRGAGPVATQLARATAAGFAVSLAVEVAQYALAAGYSDVEDLLFNTAGALLGALAASRWKSATTLRLLAAASALGAAAFLLAATPG